MHPLARGLFFTDTIVVGKDCAGNPIKAEGLFLNWFGRNVVLVVMLAWSALMLASAAAHAVQ